MKRSPGSEERAGKYSLQLDRVEGWWISRFALSGGLGTPVESETAELENVPDLIEC